MGMFSPHSSPQSLLYKKYINDLIKSGEIHPIAIEIYKYECERKLVKIVPLVVFIYTI